MTKEEKRRKLSSYCKNTSCHKCKLRGKPGQWDHELSKNCLDLSVATEAELDLGLQMCGISIDTPSAVTPEKTNDPVNRPAHYTDGNIEVIDFIKDKNLGFCLGNAVKYIARAGKKDPTKEVEDLKKARWYIERRIIELEEVIK